MMDYDLVREFAAKSVPLVNVAKVRIQTSTAGAPGKWSADFIRTLVMSELALPLKDAQVVADHVVSVALREIYEEGLPAEEKAVRVEQRRKVDAQFDEKSRKTKALLKAFEEEP